MAAEWYPDGSALLVAHGFEARSDLWRYDLASGELARVETPPGTVSGASARPDGTVEYLWSSAAEPSVVRSTNGKVVLDPPGPKSPGSVPVEDVWVDGPGGRIHALVQRPAGTTGPLPTVFDIHGGPTWHDSDSFAAGPAAWVDHGYAVVRVNYRGSTGYGRAWTDALKHRVGLIELEDIAAVRAWAVDSGLADPERLVLTGGSWGGYLTLLGLGTQPDAWTVGIAAVPVADYVTAYHDEMEALKAMDRTLLGGTPEEVPERFAASSPLTYVDAVKAPVYISAGVNDPRCPIRQIDNYVDRLAAREAAARGLPLRRGPRLPRRRGAHQAGPPGTGLRGAAPGALRRAPAVASRPAGAGRDGPVTSRRAAARAHPPGPGGSTRRGAAGRPARGRRRPDGRAGAGRHGPGRRRCGRPISSASPRRVAASSTRSSAFST